MRPVMNECATRMLRAALLMFTDLVIDKKIRPMALCAGHFTHNENGASALVHSPASRRRTCAQRIALKPTRRRSMEDMDPPDPSVQVVRSLLACAGCFVPSSAFATSTADWQPEPQPAGQGSAGATAPLGPRSGATAPATIAGTADDGPTALSIVPSSDAAFHLSLIHI